MKSYREIADKVFERRDKYLVARKRKRKKIIKRTSASVCALIVVLGVSAWHLEWFKPNVNDKTTVYSQTNPQYASPNDQTLTLLESPTTTTTINTTTTTIRETSWYENDFKYTLPIYNPFTTTTRKGIDWLDYTKGTHLSGEYSSPVDWVVEGDNAHLLFKRARYLVVDTNKGNIIKDVVLPSAPAKMRIIGNEIWISYPSLGKIVVYNKSDVSINREIILPYEVTEFDVYRDYLFFCVGEQCMHVYRYNLVTQALTGINRANANGFDPGEVLINPDENVLYIGCSGSTQSTLYCYDLDTLELKAYYRPEVQWGQLNSSKRVYLCDGGVYWAQFCLNAKDVTKREDLYCGFNKCGIVYVDDNYVINIVGIYERNGEQIHYLNLQSSTKGAMITESGNLVVVEYDSVYIVKNLL